jgi:hypothetical protein
MFHVGKNHIFTNNSTGEINLVSGNNEDLIIHNQNLKAYASLFMYGNSAATSISTIDVRVKAAGTTAASVIQNFTHSPNRLTYTGSQTKGFFCNAVITASAGDTNSLIFELRKNGDANDISTLAVANSAGEVETTTHSIFQLAKDDYVELWVANGTNTDNITVEDLSLCIGEF